MPDVPQPEATPVPKWALGVALFVIPLLLSGMVTWFGGDKQAAVLEQRVVVLEAQVAELGVEHGAIHARITSNSSKLGKVDVVDESLKGLRVASDRNYEEIRSLSSSVQDLLVRLGAR